MIPTREQIEADWANPRFTPETTALIWLRAMRDEIDRLRADLDRANTEAALARDAMAKATTDTRAKVQNELRSVERALCSADVLIKYAAWSRGAYECHVKNTIETAIDALRDDSATTPYSPPFEGDPKDCAFKASDPVREEDIKAWRDWALGDIADPDLYDDCFVLSRAEIDSAVALMRSAGDGKELLRELRAWVADKAGMHLREGFGWFLNSAVERIDEMLARPAPVDKPAAAVPDDIGLGPVTDEMVQSGIAAVKDGRWITLEQLRKELAPAPDDTRELVAQLADVAAEFFVAPWCDRAKAIAKQLRGGA